MRKATFAEQSGERRIAVKRRHDEWYDERLQNWPRQRSANAPYLAEDREAVGHGSAGYVRPLRSIVVQVCRDGGPRMQAEWSRSLLGPVSVGSDADVCSKRTRGSLVFLFCNIHTQTGYYMKWMCHRLQIFSAAVLPNITKIGQHLIE